MTSRTRLKDPNAPKKYPSAYFVFVSKNRYAVSEKLFTTKAALINRELATQWGKLSEEERQPYIAKAAKKRKIYEEQMEDYKQTESYKNFECSRKEARAAQNKARKASAAAVAPGDQTDKASAAAVTLGAQTDEHVLDSNKFAGLATLPNEVLMAELCRRLVISPESLVAAMSTTIPVPTLQVDSSTQAPKENSNGAASSNRAAGVELPVKVSFRGFKAWFKKKRDKIAHASGITNDAILYEEARQRWALLSDDIRNKWATKMATGEDTTQQR